MTIHTPGVASALVLRTQRTVALARAAVGLRHRFKMGSDGGNTELASLKARMTTFTAFTNSIWHTRSGS